MKRGQVTLFIILGILVVSLVGLGIYFRKEIVSGIRGEEIVKATVLPKEVEEVDGYVKSCVDEVLNDGVDLLKQQGGFIKVDDKANDRYGFSNNLKFRTIIVPYWLYKKENGILIEDMPSIEKMQNDLGKYINDHLFNCIDFSKLSDYGINKGEVESKIKINDRNIDAKINLPLDITYKGEKFILNDFNVIKNSNFGSLYNRAKLIFEKNSRDNYLEEKTIDMLVLYDEIPLDGIDFNCFIKRWSKTKIKSDFRSILERNIPLIRIRGADYSIKADRQYFEWDALRGLNKNLHVSFTYLNNWPLELEVEPSNGDILEVQSYINRNNEALAFLSSIFCLNNWHFVYDIRYPVLVMLEENGEVFQFALQVIVDNNQAKENKVETEIYNTKSALCSNDYGKIEVYTLDDRNEILDDVGLSYKCLNSICNLGKSNKNGYFNGDVVQCINGFLVGSKEGYHKSKLEVSTNEEKAVYLNLEPYHNLDVSVLLNDNGVIRKLRGGEEVLINLNEEEKEFSNSVIYPEQSNLSLISGKYKASVNVVDKGEFVIRSSKIEKCVETEDRFFGLFKKKECFEVEMPNLNLDKVVKGGSEFEFEILKSELGNSKRITFTVFVDRVPVNYDELQDVYDKIKASRGSVKLE